MSGKEAAYSALLEEKRETLRGRKLKIPFLEIWVGQSCTLRCRECSHLIPYVPQRLYDMEALVLDCQRILSVAEVEFFSIVGGEPFCHPRLDELLYYVAGCRKITEGKIVTNGTVLLSGRTLEALGALSGKLKVHINRYPGTEERALAFYRALQERGIPSQISSHEAWKWKRLNPPKGERFPEEETKERFRGCWVKECNTLADGVFAICPRGITSGEVFRFSPSPYEQVRIREIHDETELKARMAVCTDMETAKEFCRYCRGICHGNTCEAIPGEQLL